MMKPMSLFRRSQHGSAITPQDINGATVSGSTISLPWKQGTEIRFLFHGGAWAATTNLICKVQAQRISDDGWDDLQNPSAADVEFLQTKLDDAGAGEAATISGTLDLTSIDSDTYKALRLECQNTASVAALVAATYEIYGLYVFEPGDANSGGIDDMWELQKA